MASPTAQPPLRFVTQTRNGLELFGCQPAGAVEKVREISEASGSSFVVFSPCGSLVACADKSDSAVLLLRCSDGSVVHQLPSAKATSAAFSPRSTTVVTWRRDTRADFDEPNMAVFATASGALLASFVQKRWPALFWSPDEALCLRAMSSSIYVVDGRNLLQNPPQSMLEERVSGLSVSLGSPPCVAVLTTSKQGKPGSVRIYELGQLHQEPKLAQDITRVDSADLLWNRQGTTLLVHSKTDVDTTGRSYYGNSSLFLLDLPSKQVWHVKMGQGERVHDVVWSPVGTEFVAVYGEMPGNKATLFSQHGEVVFQFPTAARNTVSWSPDGRLLLIAGFGNLNGEMNVWNREKLSSRGNQGRIGQMGDSSVTSFSWSPDSRSILTSVCAPRMQVDNRAVLWKHNGTVLHKADYDALFLAEFAPVPAQRFQPRDYSPTPMGHSTVTIGAKAATKAPVYRSAYSNSSISDAIKSYKSSSTSSFVGRTAACGS
eukprot:RCo044871